MDDAPGWILRDPSEPHDFLEGFIGRTLKVLVHFQERNDLIVHGGAFEFAADMIPKSRRRGCVRNVVKVGESAEFLER